MDPVHGSQWSVSSTDITLTAKQGAALTSSYGSNSKGEVSTGTVSTALTGQRSQPTDAARQLFIVDDMASRVMHLTQLPPMRFPLAQPHRP